MNARLTSAATKGRGFTLIEILVALTLMATLAALVLPLTEQTVRRERETQLQRALREIRLGIDAYKQAAEAGKIDKSIDDSGYPPSLEALVDGVPDKTDPNGQRLYFLRRIPRDPTCDCPDMSAVQTWQLRSYSSPADAPSAGKDVFDVLSKSEGEGLNGIPYKQW